MRLHTLSSTGTVRGSFARFRIPARNTGFGTAIVFSANCGYTARNFPRSVLLRQTIASNRRKSAASFFVTARVHSFSSRQAA